MNLNIHKKERVYFSLMVVISLIAYGGIGAMAIVNPAAIKVIGIYLLVFLALRSILPIFLIGHIKANAIKVTNKQFPDVYEIVKIYSQKLNLKVAPDTYILQGNGVLNAFAVRFSKRNFVVLHSNILEAAYQEGADAVSFVIGHELGHIKRGHVSFIKYLLILPASFIPFLNLAYSRTREYTCDNIGYSLCPKGAVKGLLVLAAGKKLYKQVNLKELLLTMKSDFGVLTWIAELFATHPSLLKRIASVDKFNRDNLSSDYSESVFTSPKVEVEKEIQ